MHKLILGLQHMFYFAYPYKLRIFPYWVVFVDYIFFHLEETFIQIRMRKCYNKSKACNRDRNRRSGSVAQRCTKEKCRGLSVEQQKERRKEVELFQVLHESVVQRSLVCCLKVERDSFWWSSTAESQWMWRLWKVIFSLFV